MQNGRQVRVTKPTEGKTGGIDLSPRQRQIMEQMQADQSTIAGLENQLEFLRQRMAMNAGKLELIQELAEEYGDERAQTLPAAPPESTPAA